MNCKGLFSDRFYTIALSVSSCLGPRLKRRSREDGGCAPRPSRATGESCALISFVRYSIIAAPRRTSLVGDDDASWVFGTRSSRALIRCLSDCANSARVRRLLDELKSQIPKSRDLGICELGTQQRRALRLPGAEQIPLQWRALRLILDADLMPLRPGRSTQEQRALRMREHQLQARAIAHRSHPYEFCVPPRYAPR